MGVMMGLGCGRFESIAYHIACTLIAENLCFKQVFMTFGPHGHEIELKIQ